MLHTRSQESFGDIALMFSGARTASVVTTETTELVRIDREAYNAILMTGSGQMSRNKSQFLSKL